MPWLAGIAWVCHGSPVCPPTTCLLASDSGGPPVKAKEGSAPSFPQGDSGASGSLVRNDDQRWKIGLDEEGTVGREGLVEPWFQDRRAWI